MTTKVNGSKEGNPFRAKLAQGRSHKTREKIVKSAMTLWTQRGFDEGYDLTTVEEIADHAGVTRGTVYYYFPKKDEILRETAWVTANRIYECALRTLMRGHQVDQALDEITNELAVLILKTERATVRRVMEAFQHEPDSVSRDLRDGGFSRAFAVVFAHAQSRGELPSDINTALLGEMLSALCVSCLTQWSLGLKDDLPDALRTRAAFVLAGARAVDSSRIAGGNELRKAAEIHAQTGSKSKQKAR